MLRVPKGGEIMVRDSIKDLQETLKDNMYEIENNYQRALDLIVDLEDERDNFKDNIDEIICRLRYVRDGQLDEILNVIDDIIDANVY